MRFESTGKTLACECALDGGEVDHESLDQGAAKRPSAKRRGQFAFEANAPALQLALVNRIRG